MKILVSLVAALLCVTVQAPAAVIVYKNKFTVTRTGSGLTTKTSLTGFTLTATEGGFAVIYADAKRMRYSIENSADLSFDVHQIHAPLGKQCTAIFNYDGGQLGGMTMRGQNKTFLLPTSFFVPSAYTVAGSAVFQMQGTEWFTDDYKGSATLDKVNTLNEAGQTLATVILDVQEYLADLGYTEEIFSL